jgi:hypothetical protein
MDFDEFTPPTQISTVSNFNTSSYDSFKSYPLNDNSPNINNNSTPKSTKKPRKKLTTDQIVAISLVCVIVVGIVFLVLGFLGVFNSTGAIISLTPSLSPPPADLPVTVPIS